MRKFVAESDTSLTQDDDMLRWKVGGKSELRHMNIRNTMKKNPPIYRFGQPESAHPTQRGLSFGRNGPNGKRLSFSRNTVYTNITI